MRLIALLLLTFLPLSASLQAEQIKPVDPRPGRYHLAASDLESGRPLWRSVITVRRSPTEEQGTCSVLIEERGAGFYGREGLYRSWLASSRACLEDGALLPDRTTIVWRDQSGEAVRSLEKHYDRRAGRVRCRENGREKSFEFKSDLIDRELMGIVMPSFPFASGRSLSFHLLTHEPALYRITMANQGKELITFAGRSVECYKLEMSPDLGALNLFSAVIPKGYFWYAAEPPHDFLRYEGLESGPGTPRVRLERRKEGEE